jgi:hypothetical protein
MEAQEFGRFLKDNFKFEVEDFAIPSSKGHRRLRRFVEDSLDDASARAKELNSSSLLILHYGGHGDRNDDKHKGQERRSVWAA